MPSVTPTPLTHYPYRQAQFRMLLGALAGACAVLLFCFIIPLPAYRISLIACYVGMLLILAYPECQRMRRLARILDDCDLVPARPLRYARKNVKHNADWRLDADFVHDGMICQCVLLAPDWAVERLRQGGALELAVSRKDTRHVLVYSVGWPRPRGAAAPDGSKAAKAAPPAAANGSASSE